MGLDVGQTWLLTLCLPNLGPLEMLVRCCVSPSPLISTLGEEWLSGLVWYQVKELIDCSDQEPSQVLEPDYLAQTPSLRVSSTVVLNK